VARRTLQSRCTAWALVCLRSHCRFVVIYAVQLAYEIWVIHAFQKKSKQGGKTPKGEIDPVRDRIKILKEALQ
jgi:phage-related protein